MLQNTVRDLETERTELAESFLKKIKDASTLREEAETALRLLTTELNQERNKVRHRCYIWPVVFDLLSGDRSTCRVGKEGWVHCI